MSKWQSPLRSASTRLTPTAWCGFAPQYARKAIVKSKGLIAAALGNAMAQRVQKHHTAKIF